MQPCRARGRQGLAPALLQGQPVPRVGGGDRKLARARRKLGGSGPILASLQVLLRGLHLTGVGSLDALLGSCLGLGRPRVPVLGQALACIQEHHAHCPGVGFMPIGLMPKGPISPPTLVEFLLLGTLGPEGPLCCKNWQLKSCLAPIPLYWLSSWLCLSWRVTTVAVTLAVAAAWAATTAACVKLVEGLVTCEGRPRPAGPPAGPPAYPMVKPEPLG